MLWLKESLSIKFERGLKIFYYCSKICFFLTYTIKIYQNDIWYTFGVKVIHVLKKFMIFHKVGTWKTNVAKIVIAVHYFCNTLHRSGLTGFLNMPGFWIFKGSKCTRVPSMPLVLNIQGFCIYQGSECAWMYQNRCDCA